MIRVLLLLILVLPVVVLSSDDESDPPEIPCREQELVEVDERPKILFFAKPQYPEIARRNQWEGKVIISLWVTPDSLVCDAEMLHSSGHEVLDEAALSAAWKTKFLPALCDEKAVLSKIAVPFIFRLD